MGKRDAIRMYEFDSNKLGLGQSTGQDGRSGKVALRNPFSQLHLRVCQSTTCLLDHWRRRTDVGFMLLASVMLNINTPVSPNQQLQPRRQPLLPEEKMTLKWGQGLE